MTPEETNTHLWNALLECDTESAKFNLICDYLIKHLPSSAGNPPNLQENINNSEFWVKVKNA